MNVAKRRGIALGVTLVVIVIVGIFLFYWHQMKGLTDKDKLQIYEHLLANARSFMDDEDYEEAEKEYLKAIDAVPGRSEAYVELAELYVGQQDEGGAVKVLRQAVTSVQDEEKAAVYEPLSAIDYKSLVMEHEEEYGTIGYEDSVGMTGVCFLEKLDFDGDGICEFIIVYQDVTNSDRYTYEVWGYQGAENEKFGSGSLYGTDGGVKSLIITKHDDQFYLVTGGEDDECIRDYWGIKDGEFKIVRSSSRKVQGEEWIYAIDGKEVDMQEWEKEEAEWFDWNSNWAENDNVIQFINTVNNEALYRAVSEMKELLGVKIPENTELTPEESQPEPSAYAEDDETAEKITEDEALELALRFPDIDLYSEHIMNTSVETESCNNKEYYKILIELDLVEVYVTAGVYMAMDGKSVRWGSTSEARDISFDECDSEFSMDEWIEICEDWENSAE